MDHYSKICEAAQIEIAANIIAYTVYARARAARLRPNLATEHTKDVICHDVEGGAVDPIEFDRRRARSVEAN